MKLKELVNKIDNDTPLFIIWGPNAEAIFKREHDPDVIPENLLKMEVAIVFNEFNSLHIHVKRNSRKGSFRELLNCLHDYEYIDVYVVNRDGAKELEIEIEPVRREEEDTQEGRRNETD